MRNAAFCLSLALALTACASTEEPASVAGQPEVSSAAAGPLDGIPAFPVAALAPGQPGCTAESAQDRAIVGIQTEAMMTALACGRLYGNPNAYGEYRAMTAAHADLIAAATRAVMSEYGKGKAGVRKFDAEHTRLANQIAMTANGGNQASYCEPRRQWFEALLAADREALSRHAALVARQICQRQLAADPAAGGEKPASGAAAPLAEAAGASKRRT